MRPSSRPDAGSERERADGRIVDAHDQLAAPPFPIDPHRVVQYARSLGLSVLGHDGASIPLDHRAVGVGLRGLAAVGVLEADARPPTDRERFVRGAVATAAPATDAPTSVAAPGHVDRGPAGRVPVGDVATHASADRDR